jgi:MFS family permease
MNATNRTMVLGIVLACYLMVIVDISVIITALPDIHQGLHFSSTGLSWVQNAYALTFGGLLLLGARAGDILGRRRVFVAGIALFTAASLAAGLAQSAGWLLAARAIQGVGAAIAAPSTLAADRDLPRGRRAHPCHRLVQRRGRRGRQPGAGPGRRADAVDLVARRTVHQRAHRHRPDRPRAPLPAGDGA